MTARAIVLLAVVSACRGQERSSFDGVWVLRVEGQNILKLSLASQGGTVSGSLAEPRNMTIDQDGDITAMGAGQETLPVQKADWKGATLDLTIDDDRMVMTRIDETHASLALEGMRPWILERAPEGSAVVLASKLNVPDYPPAIRALREQLHAMVTEEQSARMAFDMARIEALDAKNRPEVLRIFDKYGWVTKSLAGKGASHDFWLLVQHQTPEIQGQLLPALEKAAKAGDASMSDYAYLYDRVQVGLGKPQHWGSQATCQDGKVVLSPVDDRAGLDARRKELYMMPIDEYLKNDYMVKNCAEQGAK